AYHLAHRVEQRTARVAGVDRRVGLDQAGESGALVAAVQSRNDSGGHRLSESEGRPDGVDGVADANRTRVAEWDRVQARRRHRDVYDGKVSRGVRPGDAGGGGLAVAEGHLDLTGAGDDMRLG